MEFIDCHCHLAAVEFKSDLDDVLLTAKKVGLRGAVVVTECSDDFQGVLELSHRYPGFCFPSLGVHPVQKNSRSVTEKDLEVALSPIHEHHGQLVAIGEVGLDFTPSVCKSEEDKQVQQLVLTRQVELAKTYNLPLNVHSRSAGKQTVELLKENGAESVLLHNFAGRPSVAMMAAQLGFFMSFPPHVVRKPEKSKLLKAVPLDNLMLETDSPSLGPEIGVRNEPKNITMVCEYISQLRNIPVDVIAACAWKNSLKLFPRLQDSLES